MAALSCFDRMAESVSSEYNPTKSPCTTELPSPFAPKTSHPTVTTPPAAQSEASSVSPRAPGCGFRTANFARRATVCRGVLPSVSSNCLVASTLCCSSRSASRIPCASPFGCTAAGGTAKPAGNSGKTPSGSNSRASSKASVSSRCLSSTAFSASLCFICNVFTTSSAARSCCIASARLSSPMASSTRVSSSALRRSAAPLSMVLPCT
mmetsp:Transcript_3264/g.13068  ORF Transcript_3264/g.13068 Transcript_3264/m.13068 type:complete len:208 (-) Transcript_3264:148-771(-)